MNKLPNLTQRIILIEILRDWVKKVKGQRSTD